MEYNWKIQSVVSPDLLPPFKVFRKRNRKVIERKLLPICGNVFTSEGGWFSFSFFMLSANNKTKK